MVFSSIHGGTLVKCPACKVNTFKWSGIKTDTISSSITAYGKGIGKSFGVSSYMMIIFLLPF